MHVKAGETYRHYKGGIYRIIAVATHTETYKTYITYQSLADKRIWVRPAKMFQQKVAVNGKKIKRFVRLREGADRNGKASNQ